MTKQELGDKARAVRGVHWTLNLRGLWRNLKFILWDVWKGGF